jgi:hypothetical protein
MISELHIETGALLHILEKNDKKCQAVLTGSKNLKEVYKLFASVFY